MTLFTELVRVAHAASTTINTNLPGPFDISTGGPVAIVANAYAFALLLAGGLAFAVIVYGAIKYTISAGNAGGQSDAKEWISQALWGLLLLVGAYIILNTINPAITKLNLGALTPVVVPTSTIPLPPDTTPDFCAPGKSINCQQMNQCRQIIWKAPAEDDVCKAGIDVKNLEICLREKQPGIGTISTTGGAQTHTYGSCHFGGSPTTAGCGDGRAFDVGRKNVPSSIPLRNVVASAVACGFPPVIACWAEYTNTSTGKIVRQGSSPNVPGDFDFIEKKTNAHLHCNVANGGCACN